MRISDWISDVCSSDLPSRAAERRDVGEGGRLHSGNPFRGCQQALVEVAQPLASIAVAARVDRSDDRMIAPEAGFRSEERRVGKEGVRQCSYRWAPDPEKKNKTITP